MPHPPTSSLPATWYERIPRASLPTDSLADEFPPTGHAFTDAVSRRDFLRLMGASLAMAGLASCRRQPPEAIVPYVIQPENAIPGRAQYFATAIPWQGHARGLVVEQHEGRPTKIEGNPAHPSSLGSTDAVTQASLLDLYDPDRSQATLRDGMPATQGNLFAELRAFVAQRGGAHNVRLRLLTSTLTSPTALAQMGALAPLFKEFTWHVHDPLAPAASPAATTHLFGTPVTPVYDFTKASRILSLDADFLLDSPGSVRYAREFAHRRRLPFKDLSPAASRTTTAPATRPHTPEDMNRLYVLESSISLTGAKADHRLALRPSEIPTLAAALASAVQGTPATGPHASWINAAAQDLLSAKGRSLIIAGDHHPPELHALAHFLNHSLGNVGQTVRYIAPLDRTDALHPSELPTLLHDLSAGTVDLLLIADTNPAYTASSLRFAEALHDFLAPNKPGEPPKRLVLHTGLYGDETAALCPWHLPLSHYLESWGDLRAHDGTATLVQPLIDPLYASLSLIELLARLASLANPADIPPLQNQARDLVQRHWFAQWHDLPTDGDRLLRWRKSLREGLIDNTASTPIQVTPKQDLPTLLAALPKPSQSKIEISLRPDPHLLDGRFANNGWLLELPRPLTRHAWDNAAILSHRTATALGLPNDFPDGHGNVPLLRITSNGHSRDLPVLLQPGHPDDTITLHLGWGRTRAGSLGNNVGTDLYPLRPTEHAWTPPEATATALPGTAPLANVQYHQVMAGHDLVRTTRIADLSAHIQEKESPATKADDKKTVSLTLYPEFPYTGYRWAMTVDQSACIGCNACVIACQAENNIPIVGKQQVILGREMHWLRIDTYYGTPESARREDAFADPDVHFQPMLCQHCEKAPCELVCPVEATSHSAEGINEMTYNRCVGTRYCSNNCPYKVRRFNFLEWNDYSHDTYKMMRNPNVTVRSRGVMEKCTYCIQRINRARINAKRDWVDAEAQGQHPTLRNIRGLSDNPQSLPPLNVLTACQQACPTEALIFGDLNDADAYVHHLRHDEPFAALNYGILTELNTQPRTTYLARLTNKNPGLDKEEART